MADVMVNLIEPLEARFNWGNKPDDWVERCKRDMVETFRNHSVEQLQDAYRNIILTRRWSTMPNVAEIKNVIDSMAAENAAKAKEAAQKPVFLRSKDEFIEGLRIERVKAQKWARDWLKYTTLGKEALRDGWARSLYNIIWQVKLGRDRAGTGCNFDDIKLSDTATETLGGDKLIAYFRKHCKAKDVDLERRIVLGEK